MDGYTITDNLDEIVLGEIGQNVLPGVMTQLMNVYGDEIAGPWEATAEMDMEAFTMCLERTEDVTQSLLCGEFIFLVRKNLRLEQLRTTRFFAIRAAEKKQHNPWGYHETFERVMRAYHRVTGNEHPSIPLGYEPVIEDQGIVADSTWTRCEVDDLDGWKEVQEIKGKIGAMLPDGICLDRAKEMTRRAVERRHRFFQLMDFISRSPLNAITSHFRYSPNTKHHGILWKTVVEAHRRNPEPGLQYLTKSQTVILNFMARRRLGWSISKAMVGAARWACENLMTAIRTMQVKAEENNEKIPYDLDIVDFNICDLEAQVNGDNPYLRELARWANSDYNSEPPQVLTDAITTPTYR
jgi:hypothetical protein